MDSTIYHNLILETHKDVSVLCGYNFPNTLATLYVLLRPLKTFKGTPVFLFTKLSVSGRTVTHQRP